MSLTIHDLIRDYLSAAQNNIQVMRRHFGISNLLRARGEGLIPAQGNVQGEDALEFSFHGMGCAVKTKDYMVDFDFDANSECNSFDAWRLMLFAESQPGRYGALEQRDHIERELKDLEQKGVITKAKNLPNSSFYKMAL